MKLSSTNLKKQTLTTFELLKIKGGSELEDIIIYEDSLPG